MDVCLLQFVEETVQIEEKMLDSSAAKDNVHAQ